MGGACLVSFSFLLLLRLSPRCVVSTNGAAVARGAARVTRTRKDGAESLFREPLPARHYRERENCITLIYIITVRERPFFSLKCFSLPFFFLSQIDDATLSSCWRARPLDGWVFKSSVCGGRSLNDKDDEAESKERESRERKKEWWCESLSYFYSHPWRSVLYREGRPFDLFFFISFFFFKRWAVQECCVC